MHQQIGVCSAFLRTFIISIYISRAITGWRPGADHLICLRLHPAERSSASGDYFPTLQRWGYGADPVGRSRNRTESSRVCGSSLRLSAYVRVVYEDFAGTAIMMDALRANVLPPRCAHNPCIFAHTHTHITPANTHKHTHRTQTNNIYYFVCVDTLKQSRFNFTFANYCSSAKRG